MHPVTNQGTLKNLQWKANLSSRANSLEAIYFQFLSVFPEWSQGQHQTTLDRYVDYVLKYKSLQATVASYIYHSVLSVSISFWSPKIEILDAKFWSSIRPKKDPHLNLQEATDELGPRLSYSLILRT